MGEGLCRTENGKDFQEEEDRYRTESGTDFQEEDLYQAKKARDRQAGTSGCRREEERSDQPLPSLAGRPPDQAEREAGPGTIGNNEGQPDGSTAKQSPEEYLFQLPLTIISEVRPGIKAAAQHKLARTELILSLLRLLRKYLPLTASRALPFRVAINHVIESEIAYHHNIHLDKKDLLALWRPAG